jgi:hypothetical protein
MHDDHRPTRTEAGAVAVVIAASAVSAGAHAALVPEHLREAPAVGVSFIVAVVLLAAVAILLALRPDRRHGRYGAALLFTGLIVAWAISRTTGLPVLHPEVEPVDAVGVVTKIAEAIGLACALWLSQPAAGTRPSALEEVTTR